jgi:hypothetical protein
LLPVAWGILNAGHERRAGMTPVTAVPGVSELSRDEGRKLVDARSRQLLGLSVDDFEKCYDSGKLDLSDPKVQRVIILLPFAR